MTNLTVYNNLILSCILRDIDRLKVRSAWNKGLKEYMKEFLDDSESLAKLINVNNYNDFEKVLLNGAPNWHEYSWGGCSLIYNEDIAERLCSPSELKRTKNGQYRPNSHEQWLDVQKRALFQASRKLYFIMFELSNMDIETRKKYLQAV